MSSALTFYNDVEMNSQLSDYKDEIKKWDSKLSTMEELLFSVYGNGESISFIKFPVKFALKLL